MFKTLISKNILKILCLFISLFIVSSNIAFAKFLIEQDTSYEINNDLSTLVTKNVTITNLEDDVIATDYTFESRYKDIYDLKGIENDKPMATNKELSDDSAIISASFNNVSIGKGTTKKFTISFKTNEIIYKTGNIYTINIPKAQLNDETTLYNVKLSVPNELGKNIYIAPIPQIIKDTQKELNQNEIDNDNDNGVEDLINTTEYYFTKEDLLNNGISAAFGENQRLNFKLLYELNNNSFITSNYEIAIPSDIKGYQQVNIQDINPKPQKLFLDKDDNLIAQFKVDSKSTQKIEVKGFVNLKTKQINLEMPSKIEDIPNSIKDKYTKSDKYWESDNEIIKNIANELYDKDLNIIKNAKNIYDYLVNNFEYNLDLSSKSYIERKGSIYAITSREPILCMEFTDTFIAIARAMGIPAKEINGYAIAQDNITNNPTSISFKSGDVLHSWPMFYEPNYGWIQIDPTWGNTSKLDYFTKLDTNHFALVIRGTDSEYPLSAGMYRTNEVEKQLNIDYSTEDNDFNTNLIAKKLFNFNPYYLLRGFTKYKITNVGNTIIYLENNKKLLKDESTTIYLKKEVNTYTYRDINDTEFNLDLKK